MKVLDPKKIVFVSFEDLNFFEGNRSVSRYHTSELSTSFEAIGMCGIILCVLLRQKLWVVDGQHTATALHRAGKQVPVYVVKENPSLTEIMQMTSGLNSSAKSWKTPDYIKWWAAIKHSYRLISDYHAQYRIPYNALGSFYLRKVDKAPIRACLISGSIIFTSQDEKILKSFCISTEQFLSTMPKIHPLAKERLLIYLFGKRVDITDIEVRRILRQRILDCNFHAVATEKEMTQKILFDIIGQGQ